MKISHKIFHLDSSPEREQYFIAMNNYLQGYSKELNMNTVEIRNQEDLLKFISNHPDFNLDPEGYNLDNMQGWRYGEIGVFASNFIAWKEFVNNTEDDYLILMEDDIMYEEDFKEVLNEYLSELPEDWDAFFFAVPPGQFIKFYGSGADIGLPNTCRVYQDHWLLCYVLNRKGAIKAIETVKQGIRLPADWYFFRQRHIFNSYSVKPNAKFSCFGSPTETTIQKQARKIVSLV